MTLYEFNILDENDKYQATWDLGTHIDTVVTKDLRINLYAINRFFVEVYYHNESTLTGKLFACRIKNGLTYSKLAEQIGLGKSTLIKVEKDKPIKQETKIKVTEFLK